ncbi:MAG: hypothetical protein J5I59_12235 [Saprospiraceae bacterium]|nr:hypothetical protein [Saprospiraceae bacterium]
MPKKGLRYRFHYILVVYALFGSLSVYSQYQLSGYVRNKELGNVEYCNIIFKDSHGVQIGYTVTDADGFWQYSSPIEQLILCTQAGFYKDTCFSIIINKIKSPIYINVSNSIQLLPEVKIISSRAYKIRGDTTFFNNKYYEQHLDKTLGDVINRIPQFSWSKSGRLEYNGKEIRDLSINGFNIFDKDHQAINRSINKDNINTIAIIESKNESNDIVYSLNLGLEEKAKNKVLGSLDIKSNIKNTELESNPYTVSTQTAFSGVVRISDNAALLQIDRTEYGRNYFMSIFPSPYQNQVFIEPPQIADISSSGNKQWSAKLNSNIHRKKTTDLTINWSPGYYNNISSREFELVTTATEKPLRWLIREKMNLLVNNANVSIKSKNSKGLEIKFDCPVSFYKYQTQKDINGDLIPEESFSNTNWQSLQISPVLSMSSSLSSKVSHDFFVGYTYKGIPTYFNLIKIQSNELNQQTNNSIQQAFFHSRTYWKINKWHIVNNLQFSTTSNRYSQKVNKSTTHLQSNEYIIMDRLVGTYTYNPLEITGCIEIPLYWTMQYNQNKLNRNQINEEITLRWKPKNEMIFIIKGFNASYYCNPDQWENGYRYTEFNTVENGTINPLTPVKTKGLSVNMNLFSTGKINYMISYNFSDSDNPITRRMSIDTGLNVLTWIQDKNQKSHTINSYLSIATKKKLFFQFSSIFNKSVYLEQNDTRSGTLNAEGNINVSFPINNSIEATGCGKVNYSSYQVLSENYSNLWFNTGLKIKTKLKKIGIELEYSYMENLSEKAIQHLNIFNAEAAYNIKNNTISFYIKGYNLLNINKVQFTQASVYNNYSESNIFSVNPARLYVGIRILK